MEKPITMTAFVGNKLTTILCNAIGKKQGTMTMEQIVEAIPGPGGGIFLLK